MIDCVRMQMSSANAGQEIAADTRPLQPPPTTSAEKKTQNKTKFFGAEIALLHIDEAAWLSSGQLISLMGGGRLQSGGGRGWQILTETTSSKLCDSANRQPLD